MDYCNSLLFVISDSLIQRLQSVQNAAARLVTSTRRCDHITPVQWIHFKIAGCVFQALTGQATAYLADDCRLISDSDRRKLRSSHVELVSVSLPERLYAIRWQKFFSCWSSSLERSTSAFRAPDLTFDRFKWGLKTYLFTLVWWDLSA